MNWRVVFGIVGVFIVGVVFGYQLLPSMAGIAKTNRFLEEKIARLEVELAMERNPDSTMNALAYRQLFSDSSMTPIEKQFWFRKQWPPDTLKTTPMKRKFIPLTECSVLVKVYTGKRNCRWSRDLPSEELNSLLEIYQGFIPDSALPIAYCESVFVWEKRPMKRREK